MEAATKEIQGIVAALGTYARLTIVGVWLPGFLVLCEVAWLTYQFGVVEQGPLQYALAMVKAIDSNIVLTAVVLLTLSVSIALGYLARDIGFALSNWCMDHHLTPARTLRNILSQIGRVYQDNNVDLVISKYPVFALRETAASHTRLPRGAESYVREFCKRWLLVRLPQLSTEGIEIEINMVIGLLVPGALFSIIVGQAIGGWVGAIVGCVVLASCGFMLYRVNWVRDIETEQAIVNFLFAHWEDLPASLQPKRCSEQRDPC